MAQVKFKRGLYADYAALIPKDSGTIYFCTDTTQIFVGASEYTKGTKVVNAQPTAATPGNVGMMYAYNGNLYLCTAVDNGSYTYVRVANVNDEAGTVTEITVGEGLDGSGQSSITTSGTISHAVPTNAAVTTNDIASSQTPAFGGSFSIPTFSTDKFGHAVSVADGTVTLPSETAINATTTADSPETVSNLSFTAVTGVAKGTNSHDIDVTTTQFTIPSNAFDAYGAAAAVQGNTSKTVKDLDDEIGTDGTAETATGIYGLIRNIDVSGDIADAISELDADVTQTAGADGLALEVVEVDGVLTSVSGSIAANTYDAYGAAAAVAAGLGDAASKDVVTSISSDSDDLPTVTAVKGYVASAIGDINQFNYQVVSSLPTASADTMYTIYLLSNSTPGSQNVYDEYITIESQDTELGTPVYTWEKIGTTEVDLSNYVQKTFTIAGVDMQDNITAAELRTALNVADGAQANVLEGVQVDGTDLTIDANKKVNVTLSSFGVTATAAQLNTVTDKLDKAGGTITGNLTVQGTLTATASQATADASGNVITTTYATKQEVEDALTWEEFTPSV